MFAFIAKRLLLAVPLTLAASLVIFAIFSVSTIDPVKRLLGERASDEELVQRMRAEFGLDDPAMVRYGRFVGGMVRGDFGTSIRTRRPVMDEVAERFPASLELALFAFFLSLAAGLSLGVAAGLNRGTPVDYGAMAVALVAVSLPVFWLALLLSHTFSEKLGWLPLDQRYSFRYIGAVEPVTGLLTVDALIRGRVDVFRDALSHLVLPAVTLAMVSSALVARMTRSSILEVVRQDYIRTARAKGLGPVGQFRHVMRNALIPVVTIVGLEAPALVGGAVITETIFAWPGLGNYLIDSILAGDLPAVQGLVMFMAVLFILTNLVIDVAYAVIDPRIRHATVDAGA